MIIRVTTEFDFDTESKETSGFTTFHDGVEVKRETTTKAKAVKAAVVLEDEAIIKLEPTKISFNNKAVAEMGIEYGDRIVIKYEKLKGVKTPFPVMEKDLEAGNKITKTNTIAYRGKANTVLAEYGTEFGLEKYKEGTWKLISKNEGIKIVPPVKDIKTVQEDAEKVDARIFVDDNDTTEIGEMSFTLTI